MAVDALGYNKRFLGKPLPFPKVNENLCTPLSSGGGFEIRYTHFSIFHHQDRRLPYMTAVNIDGEAYNAPSRAGNEPWAYCNQIPKEYQIDNEFYSHDENTFDRGHIVRRVDPCWGKDSDQAEQDSFTWVNCTPQHKKLNQKGGVWFQLEQHVIEHGVKNKLARVSVFAGPVLRSQDLPFKKTYHNTLVKIPLSFWKVIVWKKSDGNLSAVGFIMSQWEFVKAKLIVPPAPVSAIKKPLADDYFERLQFSDHKTYQVSIATIEKATGIQFDWNNVTFPYKAEPKAIKAKPLRGVHSFSEVFKVHARLAETGVGTADKSMVGKELKQSPALSPNAVKEFISRGEPFLIKRFQLTNVTL